MSLKDIEKLKEKVDKDPLSKLFVPLSEEYKKEGMIDDAINVLMKGIENQPGYMSARVALGKIYLDREMLKEALNEFEQVTKAIPDNLYAHKKLAEIYRAGGNSEMAVRSYKTVLKLNAMDEDALMNLNELQNGGPQQEPEAEKTSVPPPPPPIDQQPEAFDGPMEVTDNENISAAEMAPVEELAPEPSKDGDLAEFENSIFGFADDADASPEDLLGDKAAVEDISYPVPDEEPEAVAEIEDTAEAGDADAEDIYELEETPDEEYREMFATPAPAEAESPHSPGPVETPAEGPAVTAADADRYISEERYMEAFRVYSALLAANPGDRRILQRMDDLKQLLKMLGRGKDAVIAQLNNLLEGINNKRDEFYRNS